LEGQLVDDDETILTKRDGFPLSSDSIADIGDFITLSSGTTVQLTSIATDTASNALDRSVVQSLLDQTCTALGTLGQSSGGTIQNTKSVFGPKFLSVTFDAGVNQGAGPINPNEWKSIVGALSNTLIQQKGKRKLTAAFSIGGVVVLIVSVGALIT
jgi:hypothetical protein